MQQQGWILKSANWEKARYESISYDSNYMKPQNKTNQW